MFMFVCDICIKSVYIKYINSTVYSNVKVQENKKYLSNKMPK